MRTKRYSCPNGCKLPPRRRVLREGENHTYSYGYEDFPYCPVCGSLMPYALDKIRAFFDLYQVHPKLDNAVRLIYKSEFESAAREAFVVVETVLRKKSGLDLHGFDLATKSLKYEVDKQTGKITNPPLIPINELKSESDKNEQDGIRYMLMGFFQGPRNLYQHRHIGSGVSNSISMVLDASFFLRLLDGQSMTKNGRWIPVKVDYRDIYENTPNLFDRIRLVHTLKRRQRKTEKETPAKDDDTHT